MKRFLPIIGILSILIFSLTVRAFAARPAQPQLPQSSVNATLVLTTTPQVQGTPTTNSQAQNTPTALPQVQNTPTGMPQMQPAPVSTLPTGPGMGMRKGMMSGGNMGGPADMKGGKQRRMGMTAGKGSSTGYGTPMMGAPMMEDSVAMLLGMTTQELYNQIASGKPLAHIASEKGITQQQLHDVMMAGGALWSDPVMSIIYGHYFTGYELTGKHIQVPCSQCHINSDYENTPTTCIDCHAKDDVHKGQLGTDCAACHTTATWER